MFNKIHIRSYEVGLKFRNDEFVGLLSPGKHFVFTQLGAVEVNIVSQRDPWLADCEANDQLDVIVKSGALNGKAEVVDLKDSQRALVWIDGRFESVLGPGLYVYWNDVREVRVEVIGIDEAQLQHKKLASIVRGEDALHYLDVCTVNRDHVGVLFLDGRFVGELNPGLYAFWKDAADARVVELDMRESQVDVSGQEIMTADKVTLRMNAIITYVVKNARRAVSASTDVRQSLYRETQLALRSVVGARELDAFLAGKDDLIEELEASIRDRAGTLGLEVVSVGIRDVILPGDMKDLMNKVTEAKKAAEANLISRREETAAMRSQANTAKLLADNPTLMRLRELEVLEKIASAGNMNIVLGEKGLADRVVNLL
ncbi:Regulator of protease activity HflC, stomatin/prohibitin superfamily [Neorhodopirellula lusitana]|uniref:Regulator of protease activity HflC, stomatin/prohibitin superfamily n=1 Tax=Neorhodopirellula lusitana TaxID=445327 RepID=A0ABY1PUA0_9BACT|nr:slipin family protein [Neorhodopirellula lusitana]SMP46184.1 Regulator of protease activity HflC, stomatin/prohibitin superfamily [Neorhodopirellula lusitana]